MLKEFCSMTGAEEDVIEKNWARCQDMIFKYAPLENKKTVKHLLASYSSKEGSSEGKCYPDITLRLCQFV